MLGLPAGDSMRCKLLLGLAEGSQLLEADRCVDEVAQDQPCRLWLAVEEQRGGLVEQSLGERGIALDPFDHRLFEVACQGHGVPSR